MMYSAHKKSKYKHMISISTLWLLKKKIKIKKAESPVVFQDPSQILHNGISSPFNFIKGEGRASNSQFLFKALQYCSFWFPEYLILSGILPQLTDE